LDFTVASYFNASFSQLRENKCSFQKPSNFFKLSNYAVTYLLCVVNSVTYVKNIKTFISVSLIFIVQCVNNEANSKLKYSIVFKNM